MAKAKPIPDGYKQLIPHLTCDDCGKAIEFHKKAFGAEEVVRMPEMGGKRIMHAEMKIGDFFIFLNDDFPEMCGGQSMSAKALKGSPVVIHRYVEDCDATIQRALDAGATAFMPPEDMFWGDRYGVIIDPFGHRWSIATHIKDMTPEEMQAALVEMMSQ